MSDGIRCNERARIKDLESEVKELRKANEILKPDVGVRLHSRKQGWQFLAFVIDVFARGIMGWRFGSSMRTDFVFDDLKQALLDWQH